MIPSDDVVKILLIGKSGAGKTGSLASLIAAGYKVRILDTDKGVRALRSLLLDPNYPYAKWLTAHSIDPHEALDVLTIDQKMRASSGQIKPLNANGWITASNAIERWKHHDVDYGNIGDWGPDVVLVIDSFSTLAQMCYYYVQQFQGRLGAMEIGNEYRRDVGGAQTLLRKLLELLYCESVRCHVIIISHITWVDEGAGFARNPQAAAMDDGGISTSPDGLPSAIGRALSPHMGKYFNDVFVARSIGSGQAVQRKITTIPSDGVVCKNSSFLKADYDVSTGLAEIFAQARGQALADGFVQALGRPTRSARNAAPKPDDPLAGLGLPS